MYSPVSLTHLAREQDGHETGGRGEEERKQGVEGEGAGRKVIKRSEGRLIVLVHQERRLERSHEARIEVVIDSPWLPSLSLRQIRRARVLLWLSFFPTTKFLVATFHTASSSRASTRSQRSSSSLRSKTTLLKNSAWNMSSRSSVELRKSRRAVLEMLCPGEVRYAKASVGVSIVAEPPRKF